MHTLAEFCHSKVVSVGCHARKIDRLLRGQGNVLTDLVHARWPETGQRGDEFAEVGWTLGERPSSTTEHQCSRSRHGRGLEKTTPVHHCVSPGLSSVVVNTPGSGWENFTA